MSRTFKYILLTVAFFTSVQMSAVAQKKEDVILKAMTDELSRSMTDLKYEEYPKPFFIAYRVTDLHSLTIMSTLGAIIQSVEYPMRSRSVRVLAGGYDFNDESLDNDITSPPDMNDIDMPIDDDYFGIRRSLWSSTDNIYKNASKHFQRNTLNLTEQKKSLSEIPHRSFAKTTAANLIIDSPEIKYDKNALDSYVRELSKVFNEYENITGSNVFFNFSNGNNFFVNSEGTRVKTPFQLAVLSCQAETKTGDGDVLTDRVNYYVSDPKLLPPMDSVKKEIKKMMVSLIAKKNAPIFNEDYSGPVLIERKALAPLFSGVLFSYYDGLAANNEINTGDGYRNEGGNSPDSKIGKAIVSESMTVKVNSKLKTFKGKELLGSFQIDDEGVVPPDELVLIEKGKLKNLLNDRTITKPGQTANGFGQGPGVVTINIDKTFPATELKKMLIKEAKEEGLEYAFVLKSIDFGANSNQENDQMNLDIYRVSLTDGSEEFVRSASMNSFEMKTFKKIIAASNDTIVEQVEGAGPGNQQVVSIIMPGAVLFKQVEISGSEAPFYKEDIFVESPLRKK